jgi:hypothetical protein
MPNFETRSPAHSMTEALVALFLKLSDSQEKFFRFDSDLGTIE